MAHDPHTPAPDTDRAWQLAEVTSPISGENQEAFVYAISHDVRASARALIEIPDWLLEDIEEAGITLPEDISESFDLLRRHARRLDTMLKDLLTYSRAGRLDEAKPVELSAVCETALRNLSLPDWLEVDRRALGGVITAGEQDMVELFSALIRNAAQHGDPNGTLLRIHAETTGKSVIVTFADDGPGVPEQDIDRIFLPMKTLKRRDEVEATGLGLTMVYKIVTINGGWVFAGHPVTGSGLVIQLVFPAL